VTSGVTGHVIQSAGSRVVVSLGSASTVGVGMRVSVGFGIGAGTRVCVAGEIVVDVEITGGRGAGVQAVRKHARKKTLIVYNRIPASSLHLQ
jgi:hypothetical protein